MGRYSPRESLTLRTNVVTIVASKGHVDVSETAHIATTARDVGVILVDSAVGDGIVNSAMAHTGNSKIEILFDTELQGDVVYGSVWSA